MGCENDFHFLLFGYKSGVDEILVMCYVLCVRVSDFACALEYTLRFLECVPEWVRARDACVGACVCFCYFVHGARGGRKLLVCVWFTYLRCTWRVGAMRTRFCVSPFRRSPSR